jgi:two-component system, NarL family, sensor histidine kinase DegS
MILTCERRYQSEDHVVDTSTTAEQLQELCESLRQEQDRNRREIEEIERLIRQTQTEAEKLAQRDLSAASQLRNLQANLDRFTKDDIRNVYAMAQEVQVRLASVRAQVDQLQARHERLRERQNEIASMLSVLADAEAGFRALGGDGASRATQANDTLISEVIQAQEKERLRISLQMHDGPAQTLSNLILRAEICERLVERDVHQARAELASLKKAINATLQETRRFIFDLRPMILDDLGLVPTLRRYAQDFGEKFGLDVTVAVQNMDQRFPRHYEVALFRFVQESLNNVARHASAGTVRIVLDALGNQVQLMVEDDGTGFNIGEALMERPGRVALGFAVMRQQVETLLGGQLGVESAPGRGTRVVATVPMPVL